MRRNPRADTLYWAYGPEGLVELKRLGILDVPLRSIVAVANAQNNGDRFVVVYDPELEAVVAGSVRGRRVTIHLQSDGMYELGATVLGLVSEKKIPLPFAEPLLAARARELARVVGSSEQRADRSWYEEEVEPLRAALHLLAAADIAELIVFGFARGATE